MPLGSYVEVCRVVQLPISLHPNGLGPGAAMVPPGVPGFAPVHQDEGELETLRCIHHAAKESVPVAAAPIYPFRFRCHHEYSIPMLGHQVMERRPAQV